MSSFRLGWRPQHRTRLRHHLLLAIVDPIAIQIDIIVDDVLVQILATPQHIQPYRFGVSSLGQSRIVGCEGGRMLHILILIHDRIVVGQRLPEDGHVLILLFVFLLVGCRRKAFPAERVDEGRMLFDALLQAVLLQQYVLVVVLVDVVQVRARHDRVADHFVNVDDISTADSRLQHFVVQIIEGVLAAIQRVQICGGSSIAGSTLSRAEAEDGAHAAL